MFLYEKKDKNIYVYGLNPNHNKVITYKRNELEQFKPNFFTAEADSSSPNKVLESSDIIDSSDLNIKNSSVNPLSIYSSVVAYNNKYHSFRSDVIDDSILNKFRLGIYDDKKVVRIYKKRNVYEFDSGIIDISGLRGYGMEGFINNQKTIPTYSDEKEIIYYLLITGTYEPQKLSSHVVMKNIVSIPQSLYLLQMLIQGHLDKLAFENIDEQLPLFDFSVYPINSIPLEYLENAFKYGLIDFNIDSINQKLDDSDKILKKLK